LFQYQWNFNIIGDLKLKSVLLVFRQCFSTVHRVARRNAACDKPAAWQCLQSATLSSAVVHHMHLSIVSDWAFTIAAALT